MLEVWPIDNRDNPFDTIFNASQGYWPVDPLDPQSKLIPLSQQSTIPSLFLFEGLSTFCEFMMGSHAKGGLAARAGRGDRIGPAEETVSFLDGQLKVGGNARTHYNITQKQIHSAVVNSKKLPGTVIWTAHETVGKDDRSQKPILGPELAGTASTGIAPRWFGNTLHILRVDKKEKGKETLLSSEYRVYLKPHYTEEIPNIPYKACLRVSPLIQSKIDEIIPSFIPNDLNSFAELMKIRSKIDEYSQQVINDIAQRANQ